MAGIRPGEQSIVDRPRPNHPLAVWFYAKRMASNATSKSVRQSVTLPAKLAADVRRVAKERHVTMSRALVVLAERGIHAEAEAKAQLESSYHKFMAATGPEQKQAAGKELLRATFGKDSVAEN